MQDDARTELRLSGDQLADVSAEILARAAVLRFAASGYSMSPFIKDGDQVTIEAVKAADLRLGDVALYRSFGGRAIVHRLVGRRKKDGKALLLIRGDASSGHFEEVKPEQILGRVVEVSRNGRTFHPRRFGWRIAALLWANTSPLIFKAVRLVRRLKKLTTNRLTS